MLGSFRPRVIGERRNNVKPSIAENPRIIEAFCMPTLTRDNHAMIRQAPPPRHGGRGFSALLLFAAASVACRSSASTGGVPSATLASTRSAQDTFRPLKQRFASDSRARRVELEPRLRWFLNAYPDDGEVPLARVYLALIAADRGDVAAAQAQLAALASVPSGNTRDLAELVSGALELRAGEHARAFARLLPLVGKLIDPYARTFLDEQMVAAALGTARWYEAVAYMDLWLRDAGDQEQPAVEEAVRKALEVVPSEALELMMQTTLRRRRQSGDGARVRNAVMARLATVAVERQDTQLARRLVESAAGTQDLGEASEAVHELADSGGAPIVDGRRIGLLLSTGATHLGARAAEVLSGAVDALRADGARDEVRIITRDERDPKRTELAMLSLASQGASVLIAGLDEPQASIAAAFAEHTGIPVLSLAAVRGAPSLADANGAAFSLGEGSDRATGLLIDMLVKKGTKTCAPVGGTAPADEPRMTFSELASCHAAPAQAGEPRFPVTAWRAGKADCLLLLGDSSCAADALAEAQPLSLRFAALGLEAADLASETPRLPLLVTQAGGFPLLHGDMASPLAGYARRQGKAPSWYAALGHDAAVLARAALRQLPSTRTELADQVAERHRAAVLALAQARGELWTSTSTGFAGERVLHRELKIREVR
jgi:hypothetical protein